MLIVTAYRGWLMARQALPTAKYIDPAGGNQVPQISYPWKTNNRKIYLPAIATPEFPYTGNSQPEKVRLDIIFAAFNRQSWEVIFEQISQFEYNNTTFGAWLRWHIFYFMRCNQDVTIQIHRRWQCTVVIRIYLKWCSQASVLRQIAHSWQISNKPEANFGSKALQHIFDLWI